MRTFVRNAALAGAAALAMTAASPKPPAGEDHRGAPPPIVGSRAAEFVSSTYDAQAHTVEVVLSAGTRVKRWYGFEELLIDPAAIDLSRVTGGQCRVLDSHNAYEIDAILGSVLSTRIENGQLIGLLKFGGTDAAVKAEGMVARGELTAVSIGYQVSVWRNTEIIADPTSGDETYVWQAQAWTLMEVSFVSVPADASAVVRSAVPSHGNPSAATGDENEESDMHTRTAPGDKPGETAAPAAAAAPAAGDNRTAPAADPVNPVATATRFDATGSLDFMDQARSFGLETEARSLVERNATGAISVEIARSELLRLASEKQRAATAPALGGARVGDTSEATRDAIVGALVARALRRAPSEQSREYMGMRLLEIAISRTSGLSARERDPITILRAANTTSDFPLVLEAAANKILLERYQTAAPTYRAIAKQRDLRDFKATKLLRMGDFPTLLEYAEDGEIQAGTINEGRESVTLGSYGRILRLSRQAIVNDDLGAFDDVFGNIGQVVSRFENNLFWTMKKQNSGNGPKLADNVNLFNSTHGNLAGSGTVIDVTNLGAARAAMRKQKDLDGNALNLVPRFLLVGPDKETEADQIVTNLTPAQSSYVNPFSGKLEVVTEGSITGNAWELYADPQQAAAFSFGYLADAPGPRILTDEPFNVDGMAFRVTLDFYAGATDYRPAYRNPGA